MKHEKSCGAIVYTIHDGQILILVEHMALGHTSLPKGHVEDHETEEETALREIREETGLQVKLDTRFQKMITYSPYEGITKDVIFFVAKADDGDPVTVQPEEVREVQFLPEEEAAEAMTYDTDKALVHEACAYLHRQGK